MRNTSSSVLPIPENAFFEQAVFDQDLSQGLLELTRLSLELLDLVRGRLTRRVAGEPFLARLQELLRPTVVEVLIDPFLAAQLSNAVLAAQAFQHNADLLFSGMMPACGSANISDRLFSAVRYAEAVLTLGGFETGLHSHLEIAVATRIAKYLALVPGVSSLTKAQELISSFRQEAARIAHVCMVARADLPNRSEKLGRRALHWYDAFTALLLQIAEKVDLEPTLGKDRITGVRSGWLFEAAHLRVVIRNEITPKSDFLR